jgi:hypothetical protein
MAFRMQTSVPALVDLASEPRERARRCTGSRPSTALRGELPAGAAPGRARRALRQLYHRDWDHHSRLKGDIAMQGQARWTRPTAALVRDLKQRGCSTTRS